LSQVDTFSIGHPYPVSQAGATSHVLQLPAKLAGTVRANNDAVMVAVRTNFLILIFPPFNKESLLFGEILTGLKPTLQAGRLGLRAVRYFNKRNLPRALPVCKELFISLGTGFL